LKGERRAPLRGDDGGGLVEALVTFSRADGLELGDKEIMFLFRPI